MEQYLKRLIEGEMNLCLKSSGAVLMAGPKFCGKTTTASLFAKSSVRLNSDALISIARMNPASMLQGDTPRLIDEWHRC